MHRVLFCRKNIFLLIIPIYILAIVFSNSELNMNNEGFTSVITKIKIILVLLLLIIKFSNMKLEKFEFGLVLFSLLLSLSQDPYLITISFFILSSISLSIIFKMNSYGIYSTISWIFFLSICLIFLLYYLDYLDGVVLYDDSEYAIGNKKSFGFSHPNKASILIVQSILIALCFKNRIVFLLSLFLYIFTFIDLGGRTALGGFVILLIIYILRILPNHRNIIRYSIIFLHIIFPFLLMFLIAKDLWYIGDINLNYIASSRFSLMRNLYIENGGIHLYPIHIIGKIVDVGIVNFLIGMGFIVYYFYIYMVNSYLKKEYDFSFFALAISILCMNFMENFFNANMLASVIFFSRYLFIRRNNR